MAEINAAFDLPPNTINKLRIRKAHITVFKLDKDSRISSWGKLQNFIDLISRNGSRGRIHKDEHEHIDFVGIVPNYSICNSNRALFFPVIQYNTKFQTSISKGHLYTMVILTINITNGKIIRNCSGTRTILPLAMAWAPTESLFYSELFLGLFTKNELRHIKNCISD